jgi:hypothetical protein
MAVYKESDTNTWRVIYRYTDWMGAHKQTSKRGFPTKRDALTWEREQFAFSPAFPRPASISARETRAGAFRPFRIAQAISNCPGGPGWTASPPLIRLEAEASRAFWRDEREHFEAITAAWPNDVRDYLRQLAAAAWELRSAATPAAKKPHA